MIDLINSENNVIAIALKYLYDSPDSFIKTFTKFHGSTPLAVRKDSVTIKKIFTIKNKYRFKGMIYSEIWDKKIESFNFVG